MGFCKIEVKKQSKVSGIGVYVMYIPAVNGKNLSCIYPDRLMTCNKINVTFEAEHYLHILVMIMRSDVSDVVKDGFIKYIVIIIYTFFR